MPLVAPVFNSIVSNFQIRDYKWRNPQTSNNPQPLFAEQLTWLKDPTISSAINELEQLQIASEDIRYLNNMGIMLPFCSGKDALDFIKKSNVRISFEKTSSKNIHAQYDYSKNLIMLNDMYKNNQDFPVILALAEAILHECGHAKDNDGDSSIQEELGNLGMNAAAHRAFLKKYGDIFSESDALIIKDGVSIYSTLFFDPDPEKKELVRRIRQKYGYLPVGDMLHPPSQIAFRIKDKKSI